MIPINFENLKQIKEEVNKSIIDGNSKFVIRDVKYEDFTNVLFMINKDFYTTPRIGEDGHITFDVDVKADKVLTDYPTDHIKSREFLTPILKDMVATLCENIGKYERHRIGRNCSDIMYKYQWFDFNGEFEKYGMTCMGTYIMQSESYKIYLKYAGTCFLYHMKLTRRTAKCYEVRFSYYRTEEFRKCVEFLKETDTRHEFVSGAKEGFFVNAVDHLIVVNDATLLLFIANRD